MARRGGARLPAPRRSIATCFLAAQAGAADAHARSFGPTGGQLSGTASRAQPPLDGTPALRRSGSARGLTIAPDERRASPRPFGRIDADDLRRLAERAAAVGAARGSHLAVALALCACAGPRGGGSHDRRGGRRRAHRRCRRSPARRSTPAPACRLRVEPVDTRAAARVWPRCSHSWASARATCRAAARAARARRRADLTLVGATTASVSCATTRRRRPLSFVRPQLPRCRQRR